MAAVINDIVSKLIGAGIPIYKKQTDYSIDDKKRNQQEKEIGITEFWDENQFELTSSDTEKPVEESIRICYNFDKISETYLVIGKGKGKKGDIALYPYERKFEEEIVLGKIPAKYREKALGILTENGFKKKIRRKSKEHL